MKYVAILFVLFFLVAQVPAKHASDHPLSAAEWQGIMEKVTLLDEAGFMPSLLPVIMGNRDALQLTDQQVKAFRGWRQQHYVNMVNIMNAIIEKKVRFSVESLSRTVSSDHLRRFQEDIHALQRQLLTIKLSCRELFMASFTDEQWGNLAFIVSDDPKLAGIMSQVQTVALRHEH